jgi:TDG/mug DNA glycosylase family protein
MPSEKSLAVNQYYGHPRNAFWKIIFSVFESPFSTDYELRKSILLDHRIALWDVLEACVREGSLDSAIKQEVPNDFSSFLKVHPHIKHIFFNGQKAAKYFNDSVDISNTYKLITLPSTSPANASMSFEKKLMEWEIIKLK